MSDAPTKHPVRYWPVFTFVFLTALPVGAALVFLWDGRDVRLVPALAGIGAAFVTCLVFTWVMVRLQPVKVTGAAVHAVNWLQLPAAAEWGECEEVTFRRVMGTPFLRIKKTKGLPVWIPTFLARSKEFRDAVLSRVPAEHPMAVAVRETWPNGDNSGKNRGEDGGPSHPQS